MLLALLFFLVPLSECKIQKLQVARRLPELNRVYHHDPDDYAVLRLPLMIGADEMEYYYMLDTTSGDIEMTICPNNGSTAAFNTCCCFPYWQSSTYKQLDDHTAQDVFNDDTDVSVMTFVMRTPKTHFTGRLGLGWPATKKYPQDSFWPDAFRRNKNSPKLFSIKVGLKGCGGFYLFGEPTICKYDVGNATLAVLVTSTRFWQFALKGAKIGKTSGTFRSQAVVASNREYIGMPGAFLKRFAADYGIQWDGLYGAYTTDCNRNATLPDLSLAVEGGELRIRATEYVYTWKPLPNAKCVVSFEDSKAFGFGPEWYFGLQIMQSYCIVFDYDRKELRFKRNYYEDTESCIH